MAVGKIAIAVAGDLEGAVAVLARDRRLARYVEPEWAAVRARVPHAGGEATPRVIATEGADR